MSDIYIEIENLPIGWCLTSIENFAEVLMGQSPPSDTYNNEGVGLPFFQGKAEFTELYPVVRKWCNASNKIAEPNDILMSVRAPVGATNIANVKCSIGRGLAAIRYSHCNKFLFYFFRLIENKLDEKGTGTTFRAISGDVIKNAQIYLPPLPEQHRIVAKIEELFSSLDKGIESLKKAQEQLKIYRQAVLKWAFEGRFTNPNVKEGELPEGWVWSNVHEASISMKNGIYRSSDIYSNDGVACLRMYNIEDGKVIWFDIKRMKLTKQEIEQYQLSEGDLLVNRVNSRDLVGKTAYINKYDEPIVYESKNIRLRLKKDISGQYMNYWFLLSANKYFTSNAQQTVGMASINQKQLGDFKFPLPPTLSEQNLIVQEIEKRLSVADKLEESIATAIQQAEALRQSILKKAFEGKLLSEAELEECRNDPNWEPASVLLERIASAKLSIKRAERHNKTSQDKNKPAKNRVKS